MNYTFTSNFKPYIEGLIAQKQAIGFTYTTAQYLLKAFDKFCMEHYPQEKQLTREIVMHWAEHRPQEHVNSQIHRIIPVRQLAKYMNNIGVEAYVLPRRISAKLIRYIPHIYTFQELKSFFASIDQCKYNKHAPARHLVVSVIFRVLYCCGLRVSEVTGLKVEDVDLEIGKFIIRKSKGNKDRNVALSVDVLNLCRVYHKKVNSIFPDRIWFFPNPYGNQYSTTSIRRIFHHFWNKTGIVAVSGNHPRVQDFRYPYINKIRTFPKEPDNQRNLKEKGSDNILPLHRSDATEHGQTTICATPLFD